MTDKEYIKFIKLRSEIRSYYLSKKINYITIKNKILKKYYIHNLYIQLKTFYYVNIENIDIYYKKYINMITDKDFINYVKNGDFLLNIEFDYLLKKEYIYVDFFEQEELFLIYENFNKINSLKKELENNLKQKREIKRKIKI